MWTRLIRDVLSPVAGLAIEVHEVVVAAEPRELAVLAGLLMLGVPVDAAARLLGRQLLNDSPPSRSAPDPQRSPSSQEG